ncbi:MAG: FAD-dependent oxidoreductase [Rhodospirillales bacterium]|jgi:fumarate reductase flavoprotein subunit|nr:hypothetical protein [Rhodospirillaceae bacterium]MAF48610.1 hypothetical protein [Rhodospirillaceae bacterium]MDP6430181.1 FAD-dependent oxidoreductase [Rhodospirillales bacterium]MDP6642749.1 FAD-dependent oxidoreductase [Rhodospirillales bacterium]MDP6842943.1 FAD-dependent oxidoreductase [Rhodospirillales bacterium]|tara:strand:- start:1408 stop:2823 length:1416 start_codon:yes stop_codon:yes gene_type:complete
MSECDLAVIGAGFAGLVAAARAQQLGINATILEKQEAQSHLCNSRISSGVFSIAFHSIELPADEQVAAIRKQTGDYGDPVLIETIAANTARAAEWLRGEGIDLIDNTYTSVGGNVNQILAPARQFAQGLDWQGRGSDVAMRKLESNFVDLGGKMVRGARVQSLLSEAGKIEGVEYTLNDKTETLKTPAVVIADGGFQANPEMLAEYVCDKPEEINLRAAASACGDGLRMAAAVGARLTGLGPFYGHLQHRDAMSNDNLWPYPSLDAIAVASILVNARGRRFADEGGGGILLANVVAKLAEPLETWVVFDDDIWNLQGKSPPVAANPYLLSAGGKVYSANSLDQLCTQTGLPAETLGETVAAHNAAVGSGDLSALSPARSEDRGKAQAILTPPFYAIPVCAGITNTMGGIEVDRDARVILQSGEPMNGLYAVGGSGGGIEGGPKAGYIGGLAKAFVTGLMAAEHAAEAASAG